MTTTWRENVHIFTLLSRRNPTLNRLWWNNVCGVKVWAQHCRDFFWQCFYLLGFASLVLCIALTLQRKHDAERDFPFLAESRFTRGREVRLHVCSPSLLCMYVCCCVLGLDWHIGLQNWLFIKNVLLPDLCCAKVWVSV